MWGKMCVYSLCGRKDGVAGLPVKAAGLREVASAHVTLEQQKVIVRLFLAQQRTKLGWLPIPCATTE
jgi:hypothetical protein